ncbi:MAG: type VI secretion system domain-containing protein [Gemmatimonadota bacterium]|nr:type VI secretion system domain-containing protein [Gemmatimonadota bacterium]
MPLSEALLAPISDDEPAGPDLSFGNEYAAVDLEYQNAIQHPGYDHEGQLREPQGSFARVVELATEYLEEHSKDLKVAARRAAAGVREEGFEALADGLELMRELLDRYWDGLHPGIEARAAVLTWFGSDDVASTLEFIPLTREGHTYFHYKGWLKEGAPTDAEGDQGDDDAGADLDTSVANFGQAFVQTEWRWYHDLARSVERSVENLEALEALGREKFDEADVRPPVYKDLTDVLRRIAAASEDLLGRKPAPPPDDVAAVSEPVAGDAPAGEAVPPRGPVVQTVEVVEPRDETEAAAAIASAARVLRRADPTNPAPYLLVRGFRWGELRARGDDVRPEDLIPPSPESRRRLRTLFVGEEKSWAELLDEAEEIMATEAGRAWLDLQRYAVVSAERLGVEYRRVADALRSALQQLLDDLPHLVTATLMDDSGAASRETVEWLETQGFIAGDGASRAADRRDDADTDPGRPVREATFERAAAIARAGDPQGAIEMLMDRAEHESSERASFITKTEAAGIMVAHGLARVARPILNELSELIERHSLEEWEDADIVSRPLGLLYRSLDESEGNAKQQLYDRLAKLDPVVAIEVGGMPGAVGGRGSGAARAPEEDEPQDEEGADE